MTRRIPSLACAALGVLLASCAGGPEGPRQPGTISGDEQMAAGNFDAAASAYEREGRDSSEARANLANARHRAAVVFAREALEAASAGDIPRAQAQLVHAQRWGSDLPIVREARAALDAKLAEVRKNAATEDEARALLATDPAAAKRLLEGADPSPAAAGLRRDASLRAEAEASAQRAAEAWTANDRERTQRELDGAIFAGRPVPAAATLRQRIEDDLAARTASSDESSLRADLRFAREIGVHGTLAQTMRDALVAKLVARAGELTAARRPATAALVELEAKRLDSRVRTPALETVRRTATVKLLVRAFEDATKGKADGVAIARAVRERLALDALSGGVPIAALEDSDPARAEDPDALLVTGRVLSARTSSGRVGRETRMVSYPSGATHRAPNTERAALAAKLDDATAAVRLADETQKAAAVVLSAERKRPITKVAGPALSDAEQAKLLAAAQKASDDADRELARAKAAEFDLRKQIAAAPAEVDEALMEEHALTIKKLVKTAQLTVHVDVTFRGESLLAQDITAAATHDETVHDGFAPAGLAPDPDETPDDATMTARTTDRLAALAAGRIRAAAETAGRRHLAEGRTAAAAGRREEAAESFARFLLATPEVASTDRAEAARAVTELAGVRVVLRTGAKETP